MKLLDSVCQDNIQLPLDVYKLWTLPGFSEALSEKQKLCDVAPHGLRGGVPTGLGISEGHGRARDPDQASVWMGSGIGMMMGMMGMS